MNILASRLKTERCLLQEAEIHDLEIISSIFADNIDAVRRQGNEDLPKTLAQSLIDHTDIPPQGQPSQEKTLLVLTPAKKIVMGVVSFYQGYPTEKTIYIGTLFLFKCFQRQGFGTELIQHLEQLAAAAGYEEARVIVGLKNWEGLHFWLNLGFNQITKIVGDKTYSDATYADLELMKTRLNQRSCANLHNSSR